MLKAFEKHRAILAAVVVLIALSSVSAVGAVPYMNLYSTPPSGWVQCAGFTNTVSKDVSSGFLSGCVGAGALRIRVWDSAGKLEEDIYSSGLAWSGSSISNGGTVRALVKTNIKVNSTASSVPGDEGGYVTVMTPPAFVASGTGFTVTSGGANIDATADASSEYGVTATYNCGSEDGCSLVRSGLLDRFIAFYKPSKDYSAPAGWVECSGSDCFSGGALRVRVWDSNGVLEDDVANYQLPSVASWPPPAGSLGGVLVSYTSTYLTPSSQGYSSFINAGQLGMGVGVSLKTGSGSPVGTISCASSDPDSGSQYDVVDVVPVVFLSGTGAYLAANEMCPVTHLYNSYWRPVTGKTVKAYKPASGFDFLSVLDPSPPDGWIPCAGFYNTAGYDAKSNLIASSCLSANALLVKSWNLKGYLEDETYFPQGGQGGSGVSIISTDSATGYLKPAGSAVQLSALTSGQLFLPDRKVVVYKASPTAVLGSSDPTPPDGWVECGNGTAANINGCLNTNGLRMRVWNMYGILEEDVANVGIQPMAVWPVRGSLNGTIVKLKSTNWKGSSPFFVTTDGKDSCGQSSGSRQEHWDGAYMSKGYPSTSPGGLTLGDSSGSYLTLDNPRYIVAQQWVGTTRNDQLTWRSGCGYATGLSGRKVVIYKTRVSFTDNCGLCAARFGSSAVCNGRVPGAQFSVSGVAGSCSSTCAFVPAAVPCVNGDSSQSCCEKLGGVWTVSGEQQQFGSFSQFGQASCVNSAGEYFRFRVCDGPGCATSLADNASCSSPNSCVYNRACYTRTDVAAQEIPELGQALQSATVPGGAEESDERLGRLAGLYNELAEARGAGNSGRLRELSNRVAGIILSRVPLAGVAPTAWPGIKSKVSVSVPRAVQGGAPANYNDTLLCSPPSG